MLACDRNTNVSIPCVSKSSSSLFVYLQINTAATHFCILEVCFSFVDILIFIGSEGNAFFKRKDWVNAISKYTEVRKITWFYLYIYMPLSFSAGCWYLHLWGNGNFWLFFRVLQLTLRIMCCTPIGAKLISTGELKPL